ncbi:MAG: GerMN domain-containing protein [Lachnospiraceae bacterium]
MPNKVVFSGERTLLLLAFAFFTLFLSSCGNGAPNAIPEGYVIYCLDAEGESLEKEALTLRSVTTKDMIEEILLVFREQQTAEGHLRLLPNSVKILSYFLEDQTLNVNFGKAYAELPRTREVLARAGIVRTLVQLDGVQKVAFTVEGEPLTDSRERKIGSMTAETFIENSGREINNYRSATISLFYSNEFGERLHRESRLIYYSSSQPLEWAVVERILRGPKVQGNYATVPTGTQIISVATSEGTCYVNLSAQFDTEVLGVNPQITIYSIVNTLIENCGVTAVQISIAGESDVLFRSSIPLNQPFTANMELVEN